MREEKNKKYNFYSKDNKHKCNLLTIIRIGRYYLNAHSFQVGHSAHCVLLGINNAMKNKYAIHAYTHGPVTGSGPSVKPLKYVTHLLVAS